MFWCVVIKRPEILPGLYLIQQFPAEIPCIGYIPIKLTTL